MIEQNKESCSHVSWHQRSTPSDFSEIKFGGQVKKTITSTLLFRSYSQYKYWSETAQNSIISEFRARYESDMNWNKVQFTKLNKGKLQSLKTSKLNIPGQD